MKLVKYKDDSKIKLIKEIKTIMEGMNLVQVHLHRMCGEREGELDQLTVLKFRTGVGFGSGTETTCGLLHFQHVQHHNQLSTRGGPIRSRALCINEHSKD